MEHAPGPYTPETLNLGYRHVFLLFAEGRQIASFDWQADRDFAVRALNSHDELRGALGMMMHEWATWKDVLCSNMKLEDWQQPYEIVKAALLKAKE